jgi:formimidoylglutamate deiminase
MTILFAEHAMLPGGWADRVRIHLDDRGYILAVTSGEGAVPPEAVRLPSPVLPGMPNLHGHAFQRALAGLAEGAGEENFWYWRNQLYRFLADLDPDQAEAIAAVLYIEMLKSGYTTAAEFHYLHHDPDGRPYARIAEMALRHVEAATHAGIGLCMIPVFYAHAGFGGQPPSDDQRRFISSIDTYLRKLEALQPATWTGPFSLGIGFHSLRAATGDEMRRILSLAPGGLPIHIHVSEQEREVEHCLAWSGRRPIEWLDQNVGLDPRWCLIHATHASPAELASVARAGAVIGLCPTTEANLGDGIFPAKEWLDLGGGFGIGSDSQVGLCPASELRLLEYAQRLTRKRRGILAGPGGSVGGALYRAALAGGARALGQKIGAIEPGCRCDLVVLDAGHPLIDGQRGDSILDRWIFAGDSSLVRHVMVAGQWVVRDRQHLNEAAARAHLRRAMARAA